MAGNIQVNATHLPLYTLLGGKSKNVEIGASNAVQLISHDKEDKACELQGYWQNFKDSFCKVFFRKESDMKIALRAIFRQLNAATEDKSPISALDKLNRISLLTTNQREFLQQVSFIKKEDLRYFPSPSSEEKSEEYFLSIGDCHFTEQPFLKMGLQQKEAVLDNNNRILSNLIDDMCYLDEYKNDDNLLLSYEKVKKFTAQYKTYGVQSESIQELHIAIRDNYQLFNDKFNPIDTVNLARSHLKKAISNIIHNKKIILRILEQVMNIKLLNQPLNDEELEKNLKVIVDQNCRDSPNSNEELIASLFGCYRYIEKINAFKIKQINELDSNSSCEDDYITTMKQLYRVLALEQNETNYIMKNHKLNPIVGAAIKAWIVEVSLQQYFEQHCNHPQLLPNYIYDYKQLFLFS